MNYLAHFHLAGQVGSSLTGNFLGDAVKGSSLEAWPAAIVQGIRLHRSIDAFTDHHPEVLRALALFAPPRRRYAGIIVDMAFDHFLARHWSRFHPEPLSDFAAHVYSTLAADIELMPLLARRRYENMQAHDWLVSYQRLDVIDRALDSIAARLSRRTELYGAGEEVERYYAQLEAGFFTFYPQLLAWVEKTGSPAGPQSVKP